MSWCWSWGLGVELDVAMELLLSTARAAQPSPDNPPLSAYTSMAPIR